MRPIIELRAIAKAYDGVEVVKDIDLGIHQGEFATILGPSGCGKSTTLRIIGGFEFPDAGRVFIDGAEVTTLAPNRRAVNMVFQDYALFPHLTVTQNVAFGLQVQGWGKQAIAARVSEMLALVHMQDFARRYPAALSGGQRQRVALARALAPDPPVLLLDEPFGALDAKLRMTMRGELRTLQKTTGKTFVMVTHDQEEALELSDTVIVMQAGRVVQTSAPRELYFRPASRSVADFVGEMNTLAAELRSTDADGAEFESDGQRLRLARSNAAGLAPGARGIVGIRPEDVRLGTDRPAAGAGIVLQGRITEVVFGGVNMQSHIDCGGRTFLATASNRADMRAGAQVWLLWPAEHCVFFPGETA